MATQIVKTDLRGLLVKIQAAANTPETLNASNDGILVLDGEFAYLTDELERTIDLPGHGARPYVNVRKRGEFNFGLELRGAATPGNAAPIGPVLRACGFAQTLEPTEYANYALRTTGHEIVTLRGYSHGQAVEASDARGVLSQIELSTRNFARARGQIIGLPVASPVIDASLPNITLSSFQAPVAIETETFEVAVGADLLNAVSLTVDTNAQVEIYEGSESRFVFYREFYRPTGVLRVFKEARADFNPETLALGGTTEDLIATITGGGEILTATLKECQFGIPRMTDIDGVAGWEIPFKAVGSTNTDCISLRFAEIP